MKVVAFYQPSISSLCLIIILLYELGFTMDIKQALDGLICANLSNSLWPFDQSIADKTDIHIEIFCSDFQTLAMAVYVFLLT